jgi:hypothetical protein
MTHEEQQSVNLFVDQVKRLEASRFNKNVLSEPSITTTIIPKDASAAAMIGGLDEEALEAFLLRFRTLIRDTDRVSLRTIDGVFKNGGFSESTRLKFNQQRFFLNDWLQQISLIRFPGEAEITNETILDTFVFGEYSHKNRALMKRFQTWKAKEPHFSYLKANFILSLKVALASFSEIRRILESELNA